MAMSSALPIKNNKNARNSHARHTVMLPLRLQTLSNGLLDAEPRAFHAAGVSSHRCRTNGKMCIGHQRNNLACEKIRMACRSPNHEWLILRLATHSWMCLHKELVAHSVPRAYLQVKEYATQKAVAETRPQRNAMSLLLEGRAAKPRYALLLRGSAACWLKVPVHKVTLVLGWLAIAAWNCALAYLSQTLRNRQATKRRTR